MFSIVIPLYNKAQYIQKAIQCILNQTFQTFEIIIVDDGSTDDSTQVVKTFNDRRISLVHQRNSGVSTARNRGVELAKYDYIAFLDADDWWDTTFFEEMCQLINFCPEAALYGSNYFIVKNSKNYPTQIGLNNNFSIGYIDYFKTYSNTFWVPINCSFVVVRKSTFEQIGGFNPKLKFGEDFDLWVRLALEYKVAYLNKPLAYSNQDADPTNRALGNPKNWQKGEHVIFNLGYLEKEERQNADLKYLLDGLRVRSLIDFYLKGSYQVEVSQILQKVDFSQQPFVYNFIYRYPPFVVRVYFSGKEVGSKVKQWLVRHNPTRLRESVYKK